MRKFIHIGYPKNLSTSLQRGFFSVHPKIAYLGIGVGSNIGYADNVVSSFFEHYVKYCVRARYKDQRDYIKKHFDNLFINAEKDGLDIVGASSEHLSFAFTADGIDTHEKAERVADVFGTETQILVILRNQCDLLRSLYQEGVRVGYPGTFYEYVDYLFKFQDRNFISDLEYDEVISLYADFFGLENVHCFFYEDAVTAEKDLVCKDDKIMMLSKISEKLNLECTGCNLEHHNQALDKNELEAKRRYNSTVRHDLGNCLWDGAENHRLMGYYDSFLGINLSEEEVYKDVAAKRAGIEKAKNEKSMEKISWECNEKYWQKLIERYQSSNRNLEKILKNKGHKLPSAYKLI